ncbi:MAG: phospho-sugar mutase [Ruminococcaceae bacterium]|nr:phospho-sugar mutase [Oscillospiraceae bacterium]
MTTYRQWLESPVVDEQTKQELKEIAGNENEIQERFYKNLEFGTGGLRGIIAAGSNRMNIYTVRKASQGLAEDIKNCGADAVARGVVIAYDSRHKSAEFAMESAKVLAANGIKAYVFDELRPTPELSFAVRHLNAARGIVITASHNPKEYNGYKAYGEDGGQLPPDSSDYVTTIMESVDIFNDVKVMDEAKAREAGLIEIIGAAVDDAYLACVREQSINEENYKKLGDDFKVIYSPFHGAGNKPVRRILEMTGVKHVQVVPEQEKPDPDFSTVKSPNPEEKEGFTLAIEMAKRDGADLIFATDPDSDRLGVVVRNNAGEYLTLNGNQIGVLLSEFILRNKKEAGTLPQNGAIIKTIVTTAMIYPIAKAFDVKVYDVLTGFKFIGEMIRDFEEHDYYSQYLFGFEESYGYLAGTYARDKDAVVAAMLVCQMAADYKVNGMTLYEGLQALYSTYGCYMETLKTITLKGIDGTERIKAIMEDFRSNPPAEVNGVQVEKVWDVQASTITDKQGNVEKLELPKSNVLKFELADNSWFALRPSGTEPKIKFYFGVCEADEEAANRQLKTFSEKITEMI